MEALRRADAFMAHLGVQPPPLPARPAVLEPRADAVPERVEPARRVEPPLPQPPPAAATPTAAEPDVVIGSIHVEVRPPQRAPAPTPARTVVVVPHETGVGRPSNRRFGLAQT